MSRIVLLPGLDGTGLLFGPVLDPLATCCGSDTRLQVIKYPADRALSYLQLVDYTVAQLPTDEPYWILAESFGGPLAVLVAERVGPDCLGLILSASFVRNPHPELAWAQPLTHVLPIHTAADDLIIRAILGRFRTDALASLLQGVARNLDADVIRSRLREILAVDVSRNYAALLLPIMCLRATQDWVVPSASVQYLAEHNPRSRLHDIEAPHGLLQTRPEQACGLIAEFIGMNSH